LIEIGENCWSKTHIVGMWSKKVKIDQDVVKNGWKLVENGLKIVKIVEN
jgi:hypothetical protein